MKKIMAFLLVMILVVSSSVCVAFAAPSIEAEGVISGITAIDVDKNKVGITAEKIDGNVKKPMYNALQDLKDEANDKSLKIVGQYNVEVEDDAKYPLSVELNVLGVSNNSSVYVLLQKGNDVASVAAEVKDGKILFGVDKAIDKIAIVVDKKTAASVEEENDILSPQTSDVTLYVFVLMAIAAVAFVLVPKKAKA